LNKDDIYAELEAKYQELELKYQIKEDSFNEVNELYGECSIETSECNRNSGLLQQEYNALLSLYTDNCTETL